MDMTDDYGVDLEKVFGVIDTADVLVVRFQIIQQRLLIDFRSRPGTPPMLAIVPRAESVEDRFRSIKRLRPQFPFPEKVMSFHWPRTTPVLLTSGAWQRIVDRVGAIGGDDSVEMCGQIMQDLFAEERKEIAGAILGAEHYQTLWERQRA
ncbi:hypothetical protein AYO38_00710 [bacterium SCGC AG-212-C10]|nr:hypothetical protein AYO38_00710 [bacterium SCGC AG-212-C10]